MDKSNTNTKAARRERRRTNIIWIIFVTIVWYMFGAGFMRIPYETMMDEYVIGKASNEMVFILDMYAPTILDIFVLFLLCWVFDRNRYIWKSFLFGKKELLTQDDIDAEFYGRSRNGMGMLCKGFIIGFIMNFACIALALVHGDIKLYFEAYLSQIPFFLFALLCVTIQSTSEELWCRGFMYERLHERYPLWVVVVVNGTFFGLLHVFNPGATVLSIADIIICGLAFSLVRWYSGSIWIAMGIHAGWNYTQNIIFGLPNSGLVSEASIFHLDAVTGVSNLIYDYAFGVEGALPAVFADAILGIVCLVLASKTGKLVELKETRKQTQERLAGQTEAA
ncbi:MAG: CPBP family intramembrane metalloprotease [Mogibacterium sp.]|nr:CPBP family intramembrane metalloprotease [Mogibacterium sp.]